MSNDIPVLQRIANGDQSAVAQCIDEFGGLIWSLARRLTPNESDAEDAVQEVFVEIWRFADRFDPAKASQATFIAMIARRRLIDRLRKHNRQPVEESFDETVTNVVSAEHAAEVGADVARVATAMQGMKTEQREALRLSAWLGMSHAAIAKKMNLPLGTVKSHIRRGLLTLRQELGLDVGNTTSETLS
ncbi:MAG: sigma-70 family RNA polymerase sigma factor [Pseudomonadota bacterium]